MLYFDRRVGFENARLRYLLNARLRYSREATRSMSRVMHFISKHCRTCFHSSRIEVFKDLKCRRHFGPKGACTGSKIPRDGWLKVYSDIWWFFCAFIPQQRRGCICTPCSLMGTVTSLFTLIWAPLELSNSFGARTKNYNNSKEEKL